ncbi:MAG: AzlD domain-containing protein [Treponema sp.]|jgi:branched-subunit amino acid transport protein AzlD|nr:AzlD domain-containing protein [Treponema sp.]
MKTTVNGAVLITLVMGAVIFFCRLFPFLFFRGTGGNDDANKDSNNDKNTDNGKQASRRAAFLDFVEKTVPPVAMTVLAFNAMSGPVKTSPRDGIPVLAAAAFTALVQLWRRNPLISIFGGTALYMALERFVMR